MGLGLPPVNVAAMAAVPRERSGVASATTNAVRQTGTTLGITLLGAIVATRAAGHLAGLAGLAMALAACGIGSRRSGQPGRPAPEFRGGSTRGSVTFRLTTRVRERGKVPKDLIRAILGQVLFCSERGRQGRRHPRAAPKPRARRRPPHLRVRASTLR
jgi:hypothetical protein